ncbi:unnamed protein product [Polarella glacialis]|uniref:Beta-lactamase-related domain-containing protein n=1 Tax=Polarella glacialis TaxID=89957 RepID=A0A813H5H4_POLGL|nr:unnamed protein product [Polarella glacialis]
MGPLRALRAPGPGSKSRSAAKASDSKLVGGLPLEPLSETFESLRNIVHEPVDQGLLPGVAALVVANGRLRFMEEAGFADVEGSVPMTSTSLVRLYSMTKCVVVAALMQLVDERLLGLEDLLADHLPAFRGVRVIVEKDDGWPLEGRTQPAKRPITIRHLLTHTSGISGGAAPGIDALRRWNKRERAWIDVYKPLTHRVDCDLVPDLASWIQELAELPLWNHPGEHYSYGYGYDVLGHLIELKRGKALADCLREFIFEPLDMCSTAFDLHRIARTPSEGNASSRRCTGKTPAVPAAARRRLAVLYRRTKSSRYGADGKHSQLARVDPERPGAASRWEKPCRIPSAGGCVSSFAGGLLSTLDDYAKFLLAVLSGGAHPTSGQRILSSEMATEMLADQTAKLQGAPASASPYGNRALGLSCLGEFQRAGAPSTGGWFDGVEGVRLWGGAANTAFKFDPNGGRPVLVLIMSQVVPQDSGETATALLHAAREALKKEL